MGGEFSYSVYPQKNYSRQDVEHLFELAHQEVIRIEDKFTDFRPSPFNLINEKAGIEAVVVDEEIWQLIKLAERFSKETSGLFDISYASLGHPWRIAKKNDKTLSTKEINYYKSLIDFKKIELNTADKSVFLPHKDMRIGFGGIAKGYAVDRAFDVLKNAKLVNFSVNGSGDMRVHAHEQAPRPWRLGVRNPLSADPSMAAGLIELYNGAMATSGSYVHTLTPKDSSKDHHILNPSSGHSTNQLISVTIVADYTITADVIATSCMAMSTHEALSYLNKVNLIGILVDKSGEVLLSNKAQKNFKNE